MTWSDDDLGAHLAGTFHGQETPADADTAWRVASDATAGRTAPRRWPALAACAAATALVAGSASLFGWHGRADPRPPVSSSPSVDLESAHRAATSTLLGRLLGWPRLPDASVAVSAPSPLLTTPASAPLDSDAAHQLHETAFWEVPNASVGDLVGALSHRPTPIPGSAAQLGRLTQPAAHPRADPGLDPEADTVTTLTWQGDGRSNDGTDSSTAPTLGLMLVQVGTEVDIRADAWASWRPSRPADSLVGPGVSSIRLTYQPPASGNSVARSVVLTDSATISHLTDLVDDLRTLPPGEVVSCPVAPTTPEVATLTFRSATTTQTFSSVSCPAMVMMDSAGGSQVQLEAGSFLDVIKRAVVPTR